MRLRKASRGGRVARAAAAGALLTAIFVTPVAGRPGNPGAAEAAVRVLFIGNSLTYANELPAMVEALAAAGGLKPFAHLAVAYGDFGLEDHWVKGDAHRAIARGGWDYVVLQQGPSATEGRPSLYDYSRRYAPEIRKAGARPALYMVWPAAARRFDFDGVAESYRRAAAQVDGLLLPVGEAWRDGFHPSPAGSYLAALVFVQQLYGRTPLGLPAELVLSSGTKVSIPPRDAELLQRAAAEANAKFGQP